MYVYSLGVVRPFTNPLRGKGSGDKRGVQPYLDGGFLHARRLLMLPLKWTTNSMNIISVVLVLRDV